MAADSTVAVGSSSMRLSSTWQPPSTHTVNPSMQVPAPSIAKLSVAPGGPKQIMPFLKSLVQTLSPGLLRMSVYCIFRLSSIADTMMRENNVPGSKHSSPGSAILSCLPYRGLDLRILTASVPSANAMTMVVKEVVKCILEGGWICWML